MAWTGLWSDKVNSEVDEKCIIWVLELSDGSGELEPVKKFSESV
jgi:hypothetical protein